MKKRRPITPYNPALVERARELRNNSTKTEILLWLYLRNKQMMGFDFDRQKPIDSYIVDFYCKDLKLAIEIDGESHEGREEYDEKRDARLRSLGITVLRFSDEDVFYDTERVLKEIGDGIERRRRREALK